MLVQGGKERQWNGMCGSGLQRLADVNMDKCLITDTAIWKQDAGRHFSHLSLMKMADSQRSESQEGCPQNNTGQDVSVL